jgi:hypothetical protein
MQPLVFQETLWKRKYSRIRCTARVWRRHQKKNNSGKSKPTFGITEAYAEQDGSQKEVGT